MTKLVLKLDFGFIDQFEPYLSSAVESGLLNEAEALDLLSDEIIKSIEVIVDAGH